MRRFQSSTVGLRATPKFALVVFATAIAASAGTAIAAEPHDTELAMTEQGAPVGEGWSLVSSSLSRSTEPVGEFSAPAARKAPGANAAFSSPSAPVAAASAASATPTDGWQILAAGSPSFAPATTSAGEPSAPVAPPAPTIAPLAAPYVLVAGKSLQAQVLAWAKRAGWAIDWRTPDDWIVPNDKAFGSDFEVAVRAVFDQAGDNGADVRADVWLGNRSIVVNKTGAEQ